MKRLKTVNLLLIVAAASAMTGGARAQDATTGPGDERIPTSDVPALVQTLTAPDSRQDQRDLAARRLLARQTPDALQAIRDALQNLQTPGVAQAAATALADAPWREPALVTPLFALLEPGSTRQTIDHAATALAAFKQNPDVLARLLGLARDAEDERVRLAAIRAAGTFVDKRVAQTMLSLMDPTAQKPAINNAAQQALAYMTGLGAQATTSDQWLAWWNENRDKTDEVFRADVMRERSVRYDQVQRQLDDLQEEMWVILRDQYRQLPRDKQIEVLLSYLSAAQPTVRAIGARLAYQAALADVTPPAVKEALRGLVGDASPQVRRLAAEALALINDADAVVPLLTQLNQETDSTVRAALAAALAPIRDVRAVGPLLDLLNDPSIATAQAAAGALSDPALGAKLRETNPALAEQAAQRIMATLQQRTSTVNHVDLRRDLIRAVAPLKSPRQAPQLIRLLAGPGEPPAVLRALLGAVAELGDPQAADAIVNRMGHEDEAVRLAAIQALGKVSESFEYHTALFDRTKPAREPAPAVRDAAWGVLKQLFPKAPTEQLLFYEQQLQQDPAHRLLVLRVLRDRAKAAGDENDVAQRNQQIGDAAKQAAREQREGDYLTESVDAYRDAFKHAVANKQAVAETLVTENLMESLLLAYRDEEAIDFAQQQIRKSVRFQPDLYNKIRGEVERREQQQDYDRARELINKALNMNPRLEEMYANMLTRMRDKIEEQLRKQNLTPAQSNPILNARAD